MELKNKFAIGCIVQWYEIELVDEYLQSVKDALVGVENKENVIVDLSTIHYLSFLLLFSLTNHIFLL